MIEAKDRKRPNWLLRGFILASAALHLLILMEMTGFYTSNNITSMEISLDTPQKPSARSIPVPPQRPKTPPKSAPVAIMAPQVMPMTPLPEPSAPPTLAPIPNPVTEAISLPDRPSIAKPVVVAWAMADPAANAGSSVPSVYASREDYFHMVRMQIEKMKRYPGIAVNRQIEGQVRVKFTLDTSGRVHDVAILEKSRYEILDQAALDAVKAAAPFPEPPVRLFEGGPVALDIVIAFELT